MQNTNDTEMSENDYEKYVDNVLGQYYDLSKRIKSKRVGKK